MSGLRAGGVSMERPAGLSPSDFSFQVQYFRIGKPPLAQILTFNFCVRRS
jgi:hypothetical protein